MLWNTRGTLDFILRTLLVTWIILAAESKTEKKLKNTLIAQNKHKRSPQSYYGSPYTASAPGTCGAIVRNQEGWLYSPNYPSNYGFNYICTYEVRRYSNDICQVQLTFMDFDLEDSYGCSRDYLTLGDGARGQRICGALAPGTRKILSFPTGSHSIILIFSSDGRTSYKGFNIQVKQIQNSCSGQNDDRDSSPCYRVVNGYKGKITSPNYPYKYGLNSRCTYTIYKADRSVCTAELEFVRFDLGYAGSFCMNDYLQLPDQRLCKPMAPKKLIYFPANADYMKLYFFSGSYSSGRGFEINVNQIPGSCRQNPPYPIPNRTCNRVISGVKAQMTSPGYPGLFPSNQHCLYTVYIYRPSVCKIELDFRYFDLGHRGGSCSKTFLEYPDHSRICQSFSGRRIFDVSNLGNPITFGFYSGPYDSARGFEIVINQLINSCGSYRAPLLPTEYMQSATAPQARNCDQQIVTYFGTFWSPPRTSNVHCVYVVKKTDPLVCAVEIKFSRFKVGTSTGGCYEDYFELPDKNRMCGTVTGSRILPFPPGNQIMVFYFHSGNSNYNNFELKIIQKTDTCPSFESASHGSSIARFVRSISSY